MAATWSGSSDDSIEGDEPSDDEELMANLLAFPPPIKAKVLVKERKMTQVEKKVIYLLTP